MAGVSIPFTLGEEPLVLRSHLCLTEAQAETFSEVEIALMKQGRYEAWLVALTAEPEEGAE